MGLFWLTGLIAPSVMGLMVLLAVLRRHRWRGPIFLGTIAGGGFCLFAWGVLRWALTGTDRAFEMIFLQIALSTAGLFLFGVVAMLAAKKWPNHKTRQSAVLPDTTASNGAAKAEP